jgi:hypothetical protein
MSLIELGATVKAKKAEIAAALKEAGEREIKAALSEMFAQFPVLTGIRWTQYTPYFNDGSPCVFGVNGVEFKLTGDDASGDDEDGWQDTWGFRTGRFEKTDPALGAAIGTFDGALHAIGDGMEDVFGDHKQITCTREGISVDEHEHD